MTVQVSDPSKVEEIRRREADVARERISLILKAGANVILTTKGIDDLCLKYFVEAGAMAVRRVAPSDLKRIAKATGATLVLNLASLEGDEQFDAAWLGQAEEVAQERVADEELIIIRGTKNHSSASVLLRGANSQLLDELERCMRDALSVAKRCLESGALVAGGGAVETALSIYLENFATTLGSREQLAIAEFAEALLSIPKTLALNAALDAPELVARLRAHHHAAQTDASKKALAHSGLDLLGGRVRNNLDAGVLEPAISKTKQLQFATEAAITILRIDDLIKLAPEKKGGAPEGGPED
jgi:T-complex protein 1 subunit alpha